MRRFPVGGLALLVAGCTTSTGIMPSGPNTYALTVRTSPIIGGAMAAVRASNE